MLDSGTWGGTVEVLNGLLGALWDPNGGYVDRKTIERSASVESHTLTHLEQGLAMHKKNSAKCLLVVNSFGFGPHTMDLSKLYVSLYLIHNKEDQAGLNIAEVRSQRIIPTNMIFQEYDGAAEPNTILIEGAPGNGKTTFARTYMYDWCTMANMDTIQVGLQGVQRIPPFKLIIFVPVVSITSSVEDAVLSNIAVSLPYRKDMASLLDNRPMDCIVIFDGLDECRDDAIRQKLSKYIMQSKMGQKPRVIATARTYLCGVDSTLFERHLKCEGFTKSQAEAYIDQFFEKDKAKADKIKQRMSVVDNLMMNPLRLSMMCLGVWMKMIDISSCERLTSTILHLSQEKLLMLRELNKYNSKGSDSKQRINSDLHKFSLLSLGLMLQGYRSLTNDMINQHNLQHNTATQAFLRKESTFTIYGIEERWMYIHETQYEFLSARGLQYLHGDTRTVVMLYICARKELRNTMLLYFGLLGHKDKGETREDYEEKESDIDDMLKVCIILQGLLDKQGLPRQQQLEIAAIKERVHHLLADESVTNLMSKLCGYLNNNQMTEAEGDLIAQLVKEWRNVITAFYQIVMRHPETVFFGMMEEELYCGIIRHTVDSIHECCAEGFRPRNVIQWVIPGHLSGQDGHGSPLDKDVFSVGDDRWVMVSYGIWQYGKARVFDAWSPGDAVFAWKKHEDSRQEQDMEERQNNGKQLTALTSHESQPTNNGFQSLEFRIPSSRVSFRVWGHKGQAPQIFFGHKPWSVFFKTIFQKDITTCEFHLYLGFETLLVPLLQVVLERIDDLRCAITTEMEIWGGNIGERELLEWLQEYKKVKPFGLLKLRGVDVVTHGNVDEVIAQFCSEKIIDLDTLSCRRPLEME